MRITRLALVVGLAALVAAGVAQAGGGDYVLEGGTARQRAEVRAGLEASSFDWNIVPVEVVIHIKAGEPSRSLSGHIWLDADLLDAGRFAWAVVQDEYAHQVDFFLLDPQRRLRLLRELGGRDWCYGIAGLRHDEYGCERFASTLVWAYWPSNDNAYRPSSQSDESAAMEPRRFRVLISELLGMPSLAELRSEMAASKRAPAVKTRKKPGTRRP